MKRPLPRSTRFAEQSFRNVPVWDGCIATFLEGATGLGTEVDAIYRAMSDLLSGTLWLLRKRKVTVLQFDEDNAALSSALEWGGVAAGFLIPGGILAKIRVYCDKLRQSKSVWRRQMGARQWARFTVRRQRI